MKILNEEERKAISQLEKLAEIWPKSLWLFSASGTLYIMRKDDDLAEERVLTPTGGYSQDYIVSAIDIENDGGDW